MSAMTIVPKISGRVINTITLEKITNLNIAFLLGQRPIFKQRSAVNFFGICVDIKEMSQKNHL
ncbi:MAG: hypothetical protein CMP91_12090 [Gammaproteobacteria bacterium]|nr:hypothetical protein [Gammaproteobacteria bacterium]